jgi:hypothetical protein
MTMNNPTQSAECRVIDGLLHAPTYVIKNDTGERVIDGWRVVNLNDPANAKWKEAWENAMDDPYQDGGVEDDEGNPQMAPGKYHRVKRECERCWNTIKGGDQSKPNTLDCPACANNVEPGYVYTLEAVEK